MILAVLYFQCEMDLRLLLFVVVAVRVNQATTGSGLYIMLRNETTRYVAVWQIGDSGEASTDTFSSLTLGQCSVNVEIVGYSTMDTKRHIFVGQYMGLPYFYAVNLVTRKVSHIPTKGGYDMYRCLSMDAEKQTLIAIDGYTKQLNSIDWAGNFTPLMNVSAVSDKVGNGYSYDSKHKVLYALTLDFSTGNGYTNVLNIIDITNQKITNQSVSAEYKVCSVSLDTMTGELYAMEYEAGWGKLKQTTGDSQPASQTVYVGRINQQTWQFERLVTLQVPFYSNNFLATYSSSRGYYALAWPEPDYDPYVTTNNGVLQIVDVRNKKIVFSNQVKGWSMRGKVGASQNTQLLLDMAFSD